MNLKVLVSAITTIALSTVALPAFALQVDSNGTVFAQSAGAAGVYSGGNAQVPTDFAGTSAASALVTSTLTTNVGSGDTLQFHLTLSKPTGSSISLQDMNGASAGITSIATNASNSTSINDSLSSLGSDGTFTVTFASAVSAGANVTLATVSIDPDTSGQFLVSLDPMDSLGQLIVGATRTFSAQAYSTLSPVATVVQSAAFGTGVDIDADGNVYWADYSGGKIYKTSATSNTTTQFASAPGAIKLFVDGSFLYWSTGSAAILRLPLSNSNSTATGTPVRQHTTKSTSYGQSQGFFRIDQKNYISYNIPVSGELWQYSDPKDKSPISKSLTSNVVTLEFASHEFAVGDTIVVESLGAPFDGVGIVVTATTPTSISYAKTASNVARVSTTVGNVYRANSTRLSANINGSGNAIRGMAPSLDNSKIYLADPLKKLLQYDFSTQQISTVFSLAGVNFAPDDVTILGDGSFLFSAFSTGGYIWHFDAQGNPIHRIRVFTTGLISNGYDLRIAPDGTAIYLAAQSSGFLKIPLNPALPGRNYGVSTAIQPPAGTPKVVTAVPANVVSTSVDSVSFSTATLAGTVNANGTNANASFMISSDPTFPTNGTTTTSPVTVTGSNDSQISHALNTLTPGTTYYFKLVVESNGTQIEGAVRSFSTLIPPAVNSTDINAGPAAGGTQVTLSGTGLASPTEVKVGATAINTYSASASQVQLTTPPQSGRDIAVTTVNGVAIATFTYDAPTIANLSINSGFQGDQLVIRGVNLTGATSVSIGTFSLTGMTVVSDSEISGTIPNGSGSSLSITVRTPSGSATQASAFSYAQVTPSATPTATPSATPTPTPSVSPTSAPSPGDGPKPFEFPIPEILSTAKRYLFAGVSYVIELFGKNLSSVQQVSLLNRNTSFETVTDEKMQLNVRHDRAPGQVEMTYRFIGGEKTIAYAFEFFAKPKAIFLWNTRAIDYAAMLRKSQSTIGENKAIGSILCISRSPIRSSNAYSAYSPESVENLCRTAAASLPDPHSYKVLSLGPNKKALPNGSLYISFR